MGGTDRNQSQTSIGKMILNKILITIQGRTLILYYQIRQRPLAMGAKPVQYIAVLPAPELARFNLKGLTPEMFCVNIADMVNIRKRPAAPP